MGVHPSLKRLLSSILQMNNNAASSHMQANTSQSHPSAFMSNRNREKKISNVPGASSSSTCRRCRTPQCGPTPQRPLTPRRRTRSAPTRPGRHPLAPRCAGPRRRAHSTLARADAGRAAPPRGPPTRGTLALLYARPGGRAGTDPRGGRRQPAGGPRCGGALGFMGGRGAEWSEEIDSWSSTKG